MSDHGSDSRRFVRGAWTRCVCGYDPRDNAELAAHFAGHGFQEVDDHGQIVRQPLTDRERAYFQRVAEHCAEHQDADPDYLPTVAPSTLLRVIGAALHGGQP